MSVQKHNQKIHKKLLKSILGLNSKRSKIKSIKNKSTLNQSVNQIKQKLKQYKQNSNRITLLNPQLSQDQKQKLHEMTEKKYLLLNQDSCEKTNCSIKTFQSQVKERQKHQLHTKYSRLIDLQFKKKQSLIKWEVQRQTQKLKELQEKKELQQKLIQNKKNSETLQQIYRNRKKQEMQFRHELNLDKFDMIRTFKISNQKKQQKIIKQIERQSWINMKFKKQNAKRVQNRIKQLELDTRFQYQRARSARLKLSQF